MQFGQSEELQVVTLNFLWIVVSFLMRLYQYVQSEITFFLLASCQLFTTLQKTLP